MTWHSLFPDIARNAMPTWQKVSDANIVLLTATKTLCAQYAINGAETTLSIAKDSRNGNAYAVTVSILTISHRHQRATSVATNRKR
jgi:hypothetical protein